MATRSHKPQKSKPKQFRPVEGGQQAVPQRKVEPVERVRSRDWSIQELPGLNVEDQGKLIEQGIASTLQLCQQTATPEQRAMLASRMQIHQQHVNKWAALADLARLPSVGCQYCGLLLHAGIASPRQLAQTPFHQVHKQILKLHVATLNQADLCPSLSQVKQWVQEALLLKQLPLPIGQS